MKKIVTAGLIAALIIGALVAPAAAGKKKKKKLPAPYTSVLTYTRPAIGSSGNGVGTEALSLTSSSRHVYVSVKVADDISPTGNVSLSMDSDGDGVGDTAVTVCGHTEGSIEVPPNTTLTVFPWALPSTDCPTGFSTSGTITAIFSVTPLPHD